MKKDNESIEERLLRIDWPHTRNGREWKKSSATLKRLIHYAKELVRLGMPATKAAAMFSDLYFDAFTEFKAMPQREESSFGPKRTQSHFDEFQIMFRVDVSDVTPEELKRDYEFYCNAHSSGSNIWWTNPGGGGSGGPLHNFLSILHMDNNYAFGPTRKQAGWPIQKLTEKDAVGIYKRKEQPVRLSRSKVPAKKVTTRRPTAK